MGFNEADADKQECAKTRILAAAGEIFSEKGFRSATVREICDAAEVNIASINYYFGDKKNLYVETLLLAREIGAKQFPTPNFSTFCSPEQRLKAIILLLLNRLVSSQSEPWPVKILMAEILDPSPAALPLIEGYIQPFLKIVMETVKELLEDNASATQIRQTSFSVIAQCVYYRFADTMNRMVIGDEEYTANFSVNALARQIFSFSLAGIESLNETLRLSAAELADASVGSDTVSSI